MNKSAKAMAQRSVNAERGFIENVMEQFGKTEEEARHVLSVFIKEKAVKLNWAMGRYDLTHGAYWELDVINTALTLEVK